MADLTAYWRRVRTIAAGIVEKFPGQREIWITSVENLDKGTRPGSVTSAAPELAAQCLANQTHRLATEEEVKTFQGVLETDRDRIRRREAQLAQARGGVTVVVGAQPSTIDPPQETVKRSPRVAA